MTFSPRVSWDPQSGDRFADFPYFRDLDSFEEDWPGIVYNVPHLGFVQCFSHDLAGAVGWEEDQEVSALLVTSCQGPMLST